MTPEELAHNKRVEALALKVRLIYAQAARDAARFATLPNYDPNKPFSVENYPNTKRGFDKMMRELFEQTKSTITEGIDKEWYEANKNLDKLTRSRRPNPPKEWMQHNEKAREAFKARKESGMDLSTRVWNLSEQFKQEMELAIDVALTDGRSAAELSRDIRQYLNEPDKLFRRVRNKETGKLQLSKAAMAYHPGRGVYRSSYKNAMRLARTETNMAYRAADHERTQQLDFVLGFEVKLSNNHPVRDICDDLKGKYPKAFKYVGWHPHCRCYKVMLMMDEEEFNLVEDKLLAGEDISQYQSPNAYKDVPKGMSDWIKTTAPKAQNWANMPYFVKDNFAGGRIEKGLDLGKILPGKAAIVKPSITTGVNDKVEKLIDVEYKTALTRESAMEYAEKINKIPIRDRGGWISLDAMNVINQRLSLLLNEFNSPLVYITARKGGTAYASTSSFKGGMRISCNEKYFKNAKIFNKKLKADAQTGFHPRNCDSIESVINHEFAHTLTLQAIKEKGKIYSEFNDVFIRYESALKEQHVIYRPRNEHKEYISAYASSDLYEFVAESFAMSCGSGHVSIYAQEVKEIMLKHYGK